MNELVLTYPELTKYHPLATVTSTAGDTVRREQMKHEAQINSSKVRYEEQNKCPYNDEKRRREYYQNIVYQVCNAIDYYNNKKPGTGLVCGTLNAPSEEVQNELIKILKNCRDNHSKAALASEEEIALKLIKEFKAEKEETIYDADYCFIWEIIKWLRKSRKQTG